MITSVSGNRIGVAENTGPAPSSPASRTEALIAVAEGGQELNQFTVHLARLQSVLDRLGRIRTETHFFGTSRPAVAYSGAPLGLDFLSGEHTAAMASVAALSGVAAGSFEVNGTTISVNPAADSLQDVVDRINNAGVGVTVALDATAKALFLTSEEPRRSLNLTGDTSGFLAAAKVGQGSHAPPKTKSESFESSPRVKKLLRELGEELDALFSGGFSRLDKDRLTAAREDLREAFAGAFGLLSRVRAGDKMDTRFGLVIDFRDSSRTVLTLDSRRFDRHLGDRFETIRDFLFRETEDGGQEGLVPSLVRTLDEITDPLLEDLAGSLAAGLVLDVEA